MASSVVNSRVSGGGAKEVAGVVGVGEEEAEQAEASSRRRASSAATCNLSIRSASATIASVRTRN